jgi:hypothetical protein
VISFRQIIAILWQEGRAITEPTPPDTFWRLAEVHRAWARKLARA